MVPFAFLQGLDNDLAETLLKQIRDRWTSDSTGIEGNTLTLGDTSFLLEEGLTVKGKPLRDHEEVVGHARAIDLMYDLVERPAGRLAEADLHRLHEAVLTEKVVDIDSPVGGWKRTPNSSRVVVDGRQHIIEYAPPEAVAPLMQRWIERANETDRADHSRQSALSAYTDLHLGLVSIHPYFDGNGRMARLLSNLPVLRSGYPPIVVPREDRRDYIEAIARYQLAVGQWSQTSDIAPDQPAKVPFRQLVERWWETTMELVDEVHRRQKGRDEAAGN